MGKTPKPLKILVVGLDGWDQEFQVLASQGHIVDREGPFMLMLESYDLILGPRCFRMLPELRDQLGFAIKGARKAKYPKGGVE